MSPVYLNPQHSSTIPFLELKGDQQQQQQKLPTIMTYVHDHATNTNTNTNYNYNYFSGSSISNHRSSIDFLAMDYSRCTQEKIVEKFLSHDKHIAYPYDNRYDEVEITKSEDKISKKCKPTKLRIMQRTVATATTSDTKSKKIAGYQHVEQPKHRNRTSRNEVNGIIRMCTDCHTTTTPLWRSGPYGPKSLCNACGIRQRKARRAAAMAAELTKAEIETEVIETVNSPMSSSTTFETPKQAIVVDDMSSKIKLDHDKIHTLPLKKRCKTYNNDFWTYNNNNEENNHFEDYSKNNTLSQRDIFKDDEEEGAILLMELSCGIGCSS